MIYQIVELGNSTQTYKESRDISRIIEQFHFPRAQFNEIKKSPNFLQALTLDLKIFNEIPKIEPDPQTYTTTRR